MQLLNGPAGATVQLNLDGKGLGSPIPTEARHESLMLPVQLPADISVGQHQLKISRKAVLKPTALLRWDLLVVNE